MKKVQPPKPPPQINKVQDASTRTHLWLLAAYVLIPTYLTGFEVLDENGPKFLAMAILNLISLVVFLNDPLFRSRPEFRIGFFKSYIGLAYTLLLVITLLSFFNAINITESLMNFTRIFTVFASCYMMFVILSITRGLLVHVAVGLALLLVFDSLTVFYNMIMYISGDVSSIMDIKTVYSHKNVLASALFIKIPAAMYLMFFFSGWRKWLGYFAGSAAVFATLLLSTRAFYLGLVLLLVALGLYAMIRHSAAQAKGSWLMILRWAGLFVLAVIIYSAAQRFIFPKNQDAIWNTSIASRLSSIRADESSTGARLASWKRSWLLIGEHPLLGVGTGNWKVAVLKYENKQAPDFNYAIKNHNDFIEITAETGIPGGLIFIVMLGMVVVGFISVSLKQDPAGKVKSLFLPAFGILAYCVDAFFNFPADRPEIQTLFALYLAMAIVSSPFQLSGKGPDQPQTSNFKIPMNFPVIIPGIIVSFGVLILAVWILFQNVVSLGYQLLARQDNFQNRFAHPASFFLEGFPPIPNLTCLGEPIVVNKARYLLNEGRYKEAITILKPDFSSPYDSRRGYYISMAYDKLGLTDSAIYWGQKALDNQPLFGDLVLAVSSRMFLAGRAPEATKILDDYLKKIKTNPNAWLLSARQSIDLGHRSKAMKAIDSLNKYIPYDSATDAGRKSLSGRIRIYPYEPLYTKALAALNGKKIQESLSLFTEFVMVRPGIAEAYTFRALCLFQVSKYSECKDDIDKAFQRGLQNRPDLINLRGVCNHKLGYFDAACQDFKNAMYQGNKQAASNFKTYCEK